MIREATKNDIEEIKDLCMQTILTVNRKDYTEEETIDWASCGESTQRWEERFDEQTYWVFEINNIIAGVGSLKEGNHIGSFFVHKDFQRQGVGQKIITHILDYAVSLKTKKVDSEVSLTARPFFEKNGFYVVKQQQAKANKLYLTNFLMEKVL